MLILTRRVGESIVVGDDIVLTVFEVRGDAVRVGIEAPRSVQVHRQEVYDELKRLNEQSASPTDDAVDALRDALGPAGGKRAELSVVAEPAPAAEAAAAARAEPAAAVPEPAASIPDATTAPPARKAKPGPPRARR